MPRPDKNWERKYGKKALPKKTLLSMSDDVLSGSEKLACGVPEAQAIILQALRRDNYAVLRLLDMDDMQMYGNRIVKAYHNWAGNDYEKLIQGVKDRDSGLVKFINSVSIK